MVDKNRLEPIFHKYECGDFKWINPAKDIIVAQWVRFHCMFGCETYGESPCCPPVVPSVDECREMIGEYTEGVALHFAVSGELEEAPAKVWTRLGKLERDVFLAGHHKAFMLMTDSCQLCKDCVAEGTRQKCRNRKAIRPTAEAMGIDVYQTARNLGYPIQVVKNRDETINRYAFLLIE